MTLNAEDKHKFQTAAAILEKNKKDTEQYADRLQGITNGNSDRKQKALAELIRK